MIGARLSGWDRAAAWLLSGALHGAVLAAAGAAGFGRPAELPAAITVDLVTFTTPEPANETSPQPSAAAGPEIEPPRNVTAAVADRTVKVDPPRPRQRPAAGSVAETIEAPMVPATSGLADSAKFADLAAPDASTIQSAKLEISAASETATGHNRMEPEGSLMPAMPAAYADNPNPDYPLLARRKGFEGRVLLRVAVRPDGTAESAAIIQSSGHDILDRAARATITQWRFRPASIGDKLVAGSIDVPVLFRLND